MRDLEANIEELSSTRERGLGMHQYMLENLGGVGE